MNELVFFGILAAVVFTELTGLSPGGLIVPAYVALYLYSPARVLSTLLLSFVCLGVVHLCSRWMILYGRRRYFLFLAVGMLLKMALGLSGTGIAATIGYLVPGLLGRDMERQGILKTLLSLAIVTLFLALVSLTLGGRL
ncbi:MAG: poly-gamma-glutamate biosynthesis protein PgsC [Lawsonibacter sp.]|nr:poly-gamma-glutamate biosynthesis protein PgsC [Lawsonibacter sp.]